MPEIVPVSAIPNQTFTVLLGQQPTRLNVYQKRANVYMDIYVNDVLIIGGVVCLNGKAIVRTTYLGFSGDLAFFDNQPSTFYGPSDPIYPGLGVRWPLYYYLPSELPNPLVQ